MPGLLVTLPAGIVLSVVAFLLLYRFTPLSGKQSALVTALVVLGAYLPLVLVHWPGADVFALHLALFLVTAYLLGILSAQRDARRQRAVSGKWFHWAPALIVAFFMVIVVVDAVFVTMSMEGMPQPLQRLLLPEPSSGEARTQFPGVVPEHYYQKEQQFNRHLRDLEAQRERGWSVRYGWLSERPRAGTPQVLQVVVQQVDGNTLRGAQVRGRFIRSADSRLDQAFLLEEVHAGVYRAAVTLAAPGTWRLELTVRHGRATHEVSATTTVYGPGAEESG